MFCSNCGSELPEGVKFCGNCGASAPEFESSTVTPQRPAVHTAYATPAPIPPAWRNTSDAPGADGSTGEMPFDGDLPSHAQAPDLYAGFWRRVVSYFIDGLIVIVPLVILFALLIAASGDRGGSNSDPTVLLWLIALVGLWLYFALFERSHLQATPGKLALGLRVTSTQGQRIGFGKATGRWFGKLLSGAILDIGYMMAGWTKRKQGLHDIMAGCFVVRREGLARVHRGETWPANARAPGMPGWAIALVVVAVCLLLLVPILAAVSIPAYQSYLVRAQVSEGMSLASGAEVAIGEYYSNTGRFPSQNTAAGLPAPTSVTGKYVSAVTIGTLRDGTGAIKVGFSDTSSVALHGKYLLLDAQPQQNGTLRWSCSYSTVAMKYLPSSCRDAGSQ